MDVFLLAVVIVVVVICMSEYMVCIINTCIYIYIYESDEIKYQIEFDRVDYCH